MSAEQSNEQGEFYLGFSVRGKIIEPRVLRNTRQGEEVSPEQTLAGRYPRPAVEAPRRGKPFKEFPSRSVVARAHMIALEKRKSLQ